MTASGQTRPETRHSRWVLVLQWWRLSPWGGAADRL